MSREGVGRERKMSGLIITVWAEAAKDEDRLCKEQQGSEPSA
jgi:hypothetical protein